MTDSVNQLAEGAKQISEGNEKLQAGYKQLQDTKLLRHLQAEQIRSLTVRRLLQMESIPFRARIMPMQQHFSVAQVH